MMTDIAFGRLAIKTVRDVFGQHFQPAASWVPWTTALKVIFGVALNESEMPLFREATGRSHQFLGPLTEAWLLCGRRSGKSRILSAIAVLLACFKDYSEFLAPGERAVVAVLASDRDQANVIFLYCKALIASTPMLQAMVERETADELHLNNRVTIGI
jgi:hypothetical protein